MEEHSNKNNKPYYIGIAITAFFMLMLIFSIFDFLNTIIIGSFGFSTYLILSALITFFTLKILNKMPNWTKSFYIFTLIYISITLILLHYLFSLDSFQSDFISAITFPYHNITLLGAFGSIIVAPLHFFAKTVGTIVILLTIIVVFVGICIDKVYYQTHLNDGLSKYPNRQRNTRSNGSMLISDKAIKMNESSPSFISMPLTLNAHISQQQLAQQQELEKSQSLFIQNPPINFDNTQNFKIDNFKQSPIEDIPSKPQIMFSDTTVQNDIFSNLENEDNGEIDISQPFKMQDNQTIEDIISPTPIQNDAFRKNDSELVSNFNKPKKEKLDEDIRKVNKRKRNYVRPPIDLLTTLTTIPNLGQERFEEKARLIEQKLEEFKINAKCIAVTRGPAITRFEFEMPQGISVNKITQYGNDISMVLEARKAIRIEAPIPGKNAFGIEVPNDKVDTIGLRDLIASNEFTSSPSPLIFALGKDITNKSVFGNVAGLVHTLVAGSTGSGKSVCLNAIIISLLYKASPDDVRIILIDPKFVEFSIYENMPHLLVPQIIAEPAQAVNALNWAVEEMERRNRCFGQHFVRNIDEFNDLEEVKRGDEKKMPYIVVIVDELADLMTHNKKEIEEKILRLAQKARSAGIHMILATQRPSVDIITGTIKANLPSRIAFSLTNFMDSKTIIDQGGAEKLLGQGDMLYLPRNLGEPQRLLGPYVSNKEVFNIVDFVKKNNDTDFDEEIEKAIFVKKSVSDMFTFDSTSDEYFEPALRVAIETGTVSTSFIQRKFGVGFQRASKLIDKMESMGYISAPQGANKARKVLITEEEFFEKYGEN